MTTPKMTLFKNLRRHVRALLGLQRTRRLVPAGLKPRIGAPIVREDVRMTVQAGLSDDLWSWLVTHGWREPAVRPDRRQYREVTSSWVTRLIDCAPEQRGSVLKLAVSKAMLRSGIPQSRVAPAYAHRK